MATGAPYYLSPNAGFTPATSAQTSNRMVAQPGQLGSGSGLPTPRPVGPAAPTSVAASAPAYSPSQPPGSQASAVRPTDQGGPQSSWMQNMATFAGGNLAAPGGGPSTGPVRRLVDVLGQQPFGEDNPMTLLMQALQSTGYGLGMPTGTPAAPAQWSPSTLWPKPRPVNPAVGSPTAPTVGPYWAPQGPQA